MCTTALYRCFVFALERRRLELDWPMWLVDDKAGLHDGYYAKLLYAETPSGRNAGWQMLQYVADALWPDGIGMRLAGDPIADEETLRSKIKGEQRRRERRRRREQANERRTHLRTYASAKEARP